MRTDFLIIVVAVSAFGLSARSTDLGGEQPTALQSLAPPAPFAPLAPPAPPSPTETDHDRAIRFQLERAFYQDPSFDDPEVSVTVDNGDVAVTGNVKTERERRKVNEVAMNVPGVRSVANSLRVSPEPPTSVSTESINPCIREQSSFEVLLYHPVEAGMPDAGCSLQGGGVYSKDKLEFDPDR